MPPPADTECAGAGPNVSSELAQKCALNNLVNSYMAFNTNYHDTGLFGVHVSVRTVSPPPLCLCG